jgi:hypothetical protein
VPGIGNGESSVCDSRFPIADALGWNGRMRVQAFWCNEVSV